MKDFRNKVKELEEQLMILVKRAETAEAQGMVSTQVFIDVDRGIVWAGSSYLCHS